MIDNETYFTRIGFKNLWIIFWFVVISSSRNLTSVFSMFSFQFTSVVPKKFHCKIPILLNFTDNFNNFNLSHYIPREKQITGKLEFSKCVQYVNATDHTKTIGCINGYDYNLEYYFSSTVTEWNLVCENAWLNSISISSFFVMSFLGSIINCTLSDKFGRKNIYLLSFASLNISSLLLGLSPNVYLYIILKLFCGIFQQGCYIIGFTMILEMFALENRAKACLFDSFGWALASLVAVTIAYLTRNLGWRWYFYVTALVPSILFCFVFFTLPESVRWLLSKNRNKQSKELLIKIGKYSKPILTETEIDSIEKEIKLTKTDTIPLTNYNILDLFKNPLLRKNQLINIFIWLITAMTFYGLQSEVVKMGNPFLSFTLAVIVELPAHFCVFPLANRFGRKLCLSLFCLIVAIFVFLAALALVKDMRNFAMFSFLMGKMINTGQFNLIFMYTGEMFPTNLRSTVLGLSSSSARLGASAGTFMFQPLDSFWFWVPYLIIVGGNLINGILSFGLPETNKQDMPDTIEEIEEWNKNKGFFSFS